MENANFEEEIFEEPQGIIIFIGQSGAGKSAACFTLTENPEFQSKQSPHAGTKKFQIGSGNGFILFDTIGLNHEDYKKSEIEKDILTGLEEVSSRLKDKLDAVCYVIDMADRERAYDSIKKEIEKYPFYSKSNLIIIATHIDEFDGKKGAYLKTKEECIKFAKENLDENYENKILFWKNICTNDDQDATSNERRKTQINQFKKALSFCKNAFDLPQISSMIKIKRELYEETIWKVMSDPDLFRKKQEIKYSMEIAVEYKDEKFSNAKISSLEIIGGTLTSLGAGAIGVGSYIAGATLVKIVTYGTTGGFLGLFTTATTTTISSAYVLGSAATTVTTTAGLSTIPASIYAAAPFIIAGGVAVVNSKKCMKTIKARLF